MNDVIEQPESNHCIFTFTEMGELLTAKAILDEHEIDFVDKGGLDPFALSSMLVVYSNDSASIVDLFDKEDLKYSLLNPTKEELFKDESGASMTDDEVRKKYGVLGLALRYPIETVTSILVVLVMIWFVFTQM